MQLIPQPDGRLLLVKRTSTGTTRVGRTGAAPEFFTRESTNPESAAAAEARTILRRVAENYRNLPPSEFAYTSTVERTNGRARLARRGRSASCSRRQISGARLDGTWRTTARYRRRQDALDSVPRRERVPAPRSRIGKPALRVPPPRQGPEGTRDPPPREAGHFGLHGRATRSGARCHAGGVGRHGDTPREEGHDDGAAEQTRDRVQRDEIGCERPAGSVHVRSSSNECHQPGTSTTTRARHLGREAAPDIRLRDLTGREVQLRDLRARLFCWTSGRRGADLAARRCRSSSCTTGTSRQGTRRLRRGR